MTLKGIRVVKVVAWENEVKTENMRTMVDVVTGGRVRLEDVEITTGMSFWHP